MEPSDDTPSASLRSAAPSEREPGGFFHSSGYSLMSGVTGDFHRPYETQKILVFTIHRGALPQSRPAGVTAPSEREPGLGLYHSTGCSLKSGVTGDFHRPYETQNVLHSTVQRTGQSITEKGEFVPGKYEFTFSYVMVSSFCRTSRKYSGRGAKTRTGRPSRGWRKQRAPAWRHWVSWPSSFFLWP